MPRKTSKSVWNKSRFAKSRGKRKGAVANRRKRAYAPSRKRAQINRSNPVAENKQIEATDISEAVGYNSDGLPILQDFSQPPRYGATHPAIDGELTVANLPTGAKGFPLNDAVFNFNPDSALYQTQGVDGSSMVGKSVYQRMCAAKFLIKWPQPTMNTGQWNGRVTGMPEDSDPLQERLDWIADPVNNVMGLIPESPQTYHLYWGFIDSKYGYSSFTDPKKDEADAVTLERHINKRVEEWFNQRLDRTRFIPKTDNTMKIIGKKVLQPPWDNLSGRQPVSIVTEEGGPDDFVTQDGVIPDTLVKITWPINRKIHFQETNNFSGDGVDAAGNPVSGNKAFYKNNDWLPFAVIVNWNAASLPKNLPVDPAGSSGLGKFERTRRVPHVLINDITYYRDS